MRNAVGTPVTFVGGHSRAWAVCWAGYRWLFAPWWRDRALSSISDKLPDAQPTGMKAGDVVLDLGSGAGIDAFVARASSAKPAASSAST